MQFWEDAEIIIKVVLTGDCGNPEYGNVISDIPFLSSGFWSCNFSHMKRIGNLVAHFLARKANSGSEL